MSRLERPRLQHYPVCFLCSTQHYQERCEYLGCYLPVDQLVEQQALIEVFKFAFPLPLHVAIHVSVIPTCALVIPVAHMGCGINRKIPLGKFEPVCLVNHIPVVTLSLPHLSRCGRLHLLQEVVFRCFF